MCRGKFAAACCLALCIGVNSFSFFSFAGKWQMGSGKEAGKWWYNNLDGTYAKDGWYWIEGNYDGVAENYYFDKNGWLVTSSVIDGKEVNENGVWVKDGVVQVKSSDQSDVSTNGLNEVSTGTIELGSDLDLGTEVEIDADPVRHNSGESNSDIFGSSVESGSDPFSEEEGNTKATSGRAGSNREESSKNTNNTLNRGDDVVSIGEAPGDSEGEGNRKAGEINSPHDKNEVSDNSGKKNTEIEAERNGTNNSGKYNESEISFKGNVGRSSKDLPRSEATELVEFARKYIGVLRYVTAGTSLENGADCSGFVQKVFAHYGISIPRDSRSQYAASEKVSVEELKAGDLVFYGSSPSSIYHVGIYSGDGTIVHCTHTGDYVRENSVFYSTPYGYGRYN